MSRSVGVVGDGTDIAIHIGIVVLTSLAMVNASWNDVPQMRDHAGAHDELTLRVVINTPGVAEPVSNHLESVFGGMVTPDASVDVNSLPLQYVVRKGILVLINPSFAIRLPHLRRRSVP